MARRGSLEERIFQFLHHPGWPLFLGTPEWIADSLTPPEGRAAVRAALDRMEDQRRVHRYYRNGLAVYGTR